MSLASSSRERAMFFEPLVRVKTRPSVTSRRAVCRPAPASMLMAKKSTTSANTAGRPGTINAGIFRETPFGCQSSRPEAQPLRPLDNPLWSPPRVHQRFSPRRRSWRFLPSGSSDSTRPCPDHFGRLTADQLTDFDKVAVWVAHVAAQFLTPVGGRCQEFGPARTPELRAQSEFARLAGEVSGWLRRACA